MRTIYANDVGLIKLGYQFEDGRTEVIFDVSDIAAEFPGGLVSIVVRRPMDNAGHFVTSITRNGNIVTWLVDDYELEKRGLGKLQLIYSVKGVVAKTKRWSTAINESIIVTDHTEDPPRWSDLLNDLLEAAGELRQLTDKMQTWRDDVVRYANQVSDDKALIEVWKNAIFDAIQFIDEKVDVKQGTENSGKLLYVDPYGNVAILSIGQGLVIENGVLRVANAVTSKAICGEAICGEIVVGGIDGIVAKAICGDVTCGTINVGGIN